MENAITVNNEAIPIFSTLQANLNNLLETKLKNSDFQHPNTEFLVNFYSAFVTYLNNLTNEFIQEDEYRCNMLQSFSSNQELIFQIYKVMKHFMNYIGIKYFTITNICKPLKQTQLTFKALATFMHVTATVKQDTHKKMENVLKKANYVAQLRMKRNNLLKLSQDKLKKAGVLRERLQEQDMEYEDVLKLYKTKKNEVDNKLAVSNTKLKNLQEMLKNKKEINDLLKKQQIQLTEQIVIDDEVVTLLDTKKQLESENNAQTEQISNLEMLEASKMNKILHLKQLHNMVKDISHDDLEIKFKELHEQKSKIFQLDNIDYVDRHKIKTQEYMLAKENLEQNGKLLQAQYARDKKIVKACTLKLAEKCKLKIEIKEQVDRKFKEVEVLSNEYCAKITHLKEVIAGIKMKNIENYQKILKAEQEMLEVFNTSSDQE